MQGNPSSNPVNPGLKQIFLKKEEPGFEPKLEPRFNQVSNLDLPATSTPLPPQKKTTFRRLLPLLLLLLPHLLRVLAADGLRVLPEDVHALGLQVLAQPGLERNR